MGFNVLTPRQKALQINLDDTIYGTFAEIGAGQEVARNFFQAGGAAGTVAKTISAYDMTVSDTIYGVEESGRYVCEPRLMKMLNREYNLVVDRLTETRSENTRFFAFADTVAAKSFRSSRDCHGWLGVKFQWEPHGDPNELIIHVRMKDRENLQQQDALGIIGVNMVHGCYHYSHNLEIFIQSLMDSLSTDRIEIDMIRVSGPAFRGSDSRLWSLELVKKKFTSAVMFDEHGEVCQPSDAFYKKNIVVCRGSYRPPTHVNMDMLESGHVSLKNELPDDQKENIFVIPEISMSKLVERGGEVDSEDFLARVELLTKLKRPVLITNFRTWHDLNQYISNLTRLKIAFILGVYNLEQILDSMNYKDSNFGILGALGMLLGHRTKIYVYPATQEDQGKGSVSGLITSKNINVEGEEVKTLLQYLEEKNLIEDIHDFKKEVTNIWSRRVLKMIQNDEEGWEEMVPEEVGDTVKKKCLFGAVCK